MVFIICGLFIISVFIFAGVHVNNMIIEQKRNLKETKEGYFN